MRLTRMDVAFWLAMVLAVVGIGSAAAQARAQQRENHNIVQNVPLWPSDQVRVYCDTKVTVKRKPADYRIGQTPGHAWIVTCQTRPFGL